VSKGEYARLSSFIGAIAVSDLIKTTLGPKGMDKMLVSGGADPRGQGDVTVTNDGATILKKIPVDNAAAKVLVDISKTQDNEVGDGTTTVVVLAGELLREAEKLTMQKLHPQTIIRGWRLASDVAIKALEESAMDNSKDAELFRKDLINVAKTTLSSKIVVGEIEFFSNLCVDAVLRLHDNSDLEMITIIKKPGGSMRDSYLDDGFILDKRFGLGQKTRWEKPRILIANTSMDTDKIKIWGAKVKAHTLQEMADIEAAERLKMKQKVDRILSYGIDIFINRQLIYDYPEQLFREVGVASIEHADFEGVERLARVLGAEIMSTFEKLDTKPKKEEEDKKSETKEKEPTFDKEHEYSNYTKLGTCGLVEEVMIGEDSVIKFSGVSRGEACTIVLRGASIHLLDEMERSIHDALCVLTQTIKNSRIVLGGGASEMLMAHHVDEAARKHGGKEQMAMDGFANALRSIPTILADNAGFDAVDIVTKLRSEHAHKHTHMGIDMAKGGIGDMKKLGVFEAYKSKSQSLISAHEAAEMILRVDDIVRNAPRQRSDPNPHQ